jgi:hypothetical protein
MADPKHQNPIYSDEAKARAYFEAVRWPNGPECPHCGVVGNAVELKGKSTRPGLYKCREKECRKPFTATMGTVYEASHIPLHIWLYATHLMCASKKGISAAQLHRMLGFGSYKSAWFMAHRIREAMKAEQLPPMGSGGGMVEVDETYYGKNPNAEPSRMAIRNMNTVMTLIDRETGEARSLVVDSLKPAEVAQILKANLAREARLMTDDGRHYLRMGQFFSGHETVNHARNEYVRKSDPEIHTNTVEGFYAIFKRGMNGVYQHCDRQHLHRYVTEFDFRYSNRIALSVDDTERTRRAIKGTVGRRLRYKKADQSEGAEA